MLLDTEETSLRQLAPCQRDALRHVRNRCRPLHDRLLAQLSRRCRELGFSEDALGRTLEYIREEAPLIIHVNLRKYLEVLATDTHYKNRFEARPSPAAELEVPRRCWERTLFSGCYDGADDALRPKYGVLNVTKDPEGVLYCQVMYGMSFLVLRGVRARASSCRGDSAALARSEDVGKVAGSLASMEYYSPILAQYGDADLKAMLNVGIGVVKSSPSRLFAHGTYPEVQFHGEVRLAEHVAEIHWHPWEVREQDRPLLRQLARACGDAKLVEIPLPQRVVSRIAEYLGLAAPRAEAPTTPPRKRPRA